jgi:fengycin family lipopeptide synthetase D
MKYMVDIISYRREDNVLSLTPITFDVFTAEAIIPLIRGLKLVIGSEADLFNYKMAASLIEKAGITIVSSAPSIISRITADPESAAKIRPLRYLLLAGEPLLDTLLNQLKLIIAGSIYNLYGPTETTIYSTAKDVTGKNPLNIGKPVYNTQVYIVDKKDNPRPIGSMGELCIGGHGTGRGYLNLPELTAEKFVVNPFLSETKAERIYRTGDLVRWLPDGNIEFIGRVDHQVKIGGVRVEPGEIENCLLTHKDIKEAVVVKKAVRKENQDNELLAYLVVKTRMNKDEIKNWLSGILPYYMVPNLFVQLEKMPLTHSSKIDRKFLAGVEIEIENKDDYVAPKNKIEEKLVELWSEILGIEKNTISTAADFFELGGQSLKATILTARIHKEFDVRIPLAEVFRSSTIEGLSRLIKEGGKEKYFDIKPLEKKEYYPVTSDQKRIYMIEMLGNESSPFFMSNRSFFYSKLDKNHIEFIFNLLIKRHEVFRTSFKLQGENLVQFVHDKIDFKIKYVNSNEDEVEDLIRQFRQHFDLGKAPLLKVMIISLSEEKHLVIYNLHHIISDGMSLDVLSREFEYLLKDMRLPELKLQFKDFSVWQNESLKSDEIKKQKDYWLDVFKGKLPLLNMPTDFQRPAEQSFAGCGLTYKLEEELSRALYTMAKDTGSTLFIVSLAIYFILLSKYTGQEDIIIGTTVAGRSHPDLENVIGMLIKTLAVRSFPVSEERFIDFLNKVKTTVLDAFDNQDYPFKELLDNIEIDKDLSRNPLFDTLFLLNNINTAQGGPGKTKGDDRQVESNKPEINIKGKKSSELIITRIRNIDSPVDLQLVLWEGEENIVINLKYCVKLFHQDTMKRFLNYFIEIISIVSDDKNIKLKDINISHDFGTAGLDIINREDMDFGF